jgi:transposase
MNAMGVCGNTACTPSTKAVNWQNLVRRLALGQIVLARVDQHESRPIWNDQAIEIADTYAPELSPVKYIWGYMKRRELANLCLHTIGEVGTFARNRLRSMQRRPQLITAFWQ